MEENRTTVDIRQKLGKIVFCLFSERNEINWLTLNKTFKIGELDEDRLYFTIVPKRGPIITVYR